MKRLLYAAAPAIVLHALLLLIPSPRLRHETAPQPVPRVLNLALTACRPKPLFPSRPVAPPAPRPVVRAAAAPPVKKAVPRKKKRKKIPVKKKRHTLKPQIRKRAVTPPAPPAPMKAAAVPPVAVPFSPTGGEERRVPEPPGPVLTPEASFPVTSVTAPTAVTAPPVIRMATPRYGSSPRPPYPRIARRRGYEGTVVLEARIDRAGRVAELRILTSSGYRVLDRAAVAAVKNWVFIPGERDGKKVAMWVKVPIRFHLK